MLQLLLVNFRSWFRLEFMYISLILTSLISMVSAVCAAAIVHRNSFFSLYQQNKCSESKVKFFKDILENSWKFFKSFLKLPNLHMLIKQKSLSLPRNLALRTFGELPVVSPTKLNLLYLLYSMALRCFLLHL